MIIIGTGFCKYTIAACGLFGAMISMRAAAVFNCTELDVCNCRVGRGVIFRANKQCEK